MGESMQFEELFVFSLFIILGLLGVILFFLYDNVRKKERFMQRRLQNALAAASGALEPLFASISSPVFFRHRNGTFTHFNKAFSSLFPPEPSEDRRPSKLYAHETAELLMRFDDEIVKFQKPKSYETVIEIEGEMRTIRIDKQPLFAEEGEMLGILGEIHVVESADEESYRARFEVAAQSLKDGIWEWNLRTHELYFSHEWSGKLGYKKGSFPRAEEAFKALIHEEDRPSFEAEFLQAQKKHSLFEVKFRLQCAEGEWYWVMLRGQIAGEHHDKLVGYSVEVNEKERLRERVKELDSALRRMAEQQPPSPSPSTPEMALEAPTEFNGLLWQLIQQWKTPLEQIGEETQALFKRYEKMELTEEGFDEYVEATLDRMEGVAREMDRLYGLFQTPAHSTSFNATDALREALSLTRPSFKAAGLIPEVRTDEAPEGLLRGDYDHLLKVIMGLLLQSLKSAPESLSIRLEGRMGGTVLVIEGADLSGDELKAHELRSHWSEEEMSLSVMFEAA